MELKDFIGKAVIRVMTNERCFLDKITAPTIGVVTEAPGSFGYPRHYSYETINGDPFERGSLVFEDKKLAAPFREAYDAYLHTEDAYWENYGYFG